MGEENKRNAIASVTKAAEVATSEGQSFCVSRVYVGLDTTAVREAVVDVLHQKRIAVMVFSTDEGTNKVAVCAGVPKNDSKFNKLEVSEWLTTSLGPVKGRCGKGRGGLAQGQGTDASLLEQGMSIASDFASLYLNEE